MAKPAYTIGTLVTDRALYDEMKRSFIEHGFGEDCEYLIIDNVGENQADAYDGLNFMLNQARGRIVILSHQDVLLVDDGRRELDRCLLELTEAAPFWAVAGNAGCTAYRTQHTWITDKHGHFRSPGLPKQVHSLDENLLIIRPETRVAFSRDVGGFHLYGTDICLNADILGWSAHVIPFHLKHLGEARTGKAFADCKAAFSSKWRRAFRHRALQTPATHFLLTGQECPRWYSWLKLKWLRRWHRHWPPSSVK